MSNNLDKKLLFRVLKASFKTIQSSKDFNLNEFTFENFPTIDNIIKAYNDQCEEQADAKTKTYLIKINKASRYFIFLKLKRLNEYFSKNIAGSNAAGSRGSSQVQTVAGKNTNLKKSPSPTQDLTQNCNDSWEDLEREIGCKSYQEAKLKDPLLAVSELHRKNVIKCFSPNNLSQKDGGKKNLLPSSLPTRQKSKYSLQPQRTIFNSKGKTPLQQGSRVTKLDIKSKIINKNANVKGTLSPKREHFFKSSCSTMQNSDIADLRKILLEYKLSQAKIENSIQDLKSYVKALIKAQGIEAPKEVMTIKNLPKVIDNKIPDINQVVSEFKTFKNNVESSIEELKSFVKGLTEVSKNNEDVADIKHINNNIMNIKGMIQELVESKTNVSKSEKPSLMEIDNLRIKRSDSVLESKHLFGVLDNANDIAEVSPSIKENVKSTCADQDQGLQTGGAQSTVTSTWDIEIYNGSTDDDDDFGAKDDKEFSQNFILPYNKESPPSSKANEIVRKAKKKFRRNIMDSTFHIDVRFLVLECEANQKLILGGMIREEYHKTNKDCLICINSITFSSREGGDLLANVYAYCKSPNCSTYIFSVESSGCVTVFRATDIDHS